MEIRAHGTSTRRWCQPTAILSRPRQCQSTSGFQLPTDLRDWIQPQDLILLLEQAIDQLDRTIAVPSHDLLGKGAFGHLSWVMGISFPSRSGETSLTGQSSLPVLSHSRLFCLLGFSYSTGAFSSQEIVQNCHTENWFRKCAGHAIPFRNELVSFRRRHRARLAQILTVVFRRALAYSHSNMLASPEFSQTLIEEAEQRLDFARHLDSCDE